MLTGEPYSRFHDEHMRIYGFSIIWSSGVRRTEYILQSFDGIWALVCNEKIAFRLGDLFVFNGGREGWRDIFCEMSSSFICDFFLQHIYVFMVDVC